MIPGFQGTFVISWSQTEVDGVRAAPLAELSVGSSWRWTGEAIRVDGPQGLLILSGDRALGDVHRRAARQARRRMGLADPVEVPTDDDIRSAGSRAERGFVLTDGRRTIPVGVMETDGRGPIVIFEETVPPTGDELWVVEITCGGLARGAADPKNGAVICFTPGTTITTPQGPRLIEDLRPGDRIATKDDGPQEVIWTGHRRLSGARLYAHPHLRPVRLRDGALGIGRPQGDLIVSPQHRMLVRGRAAQMLFNEPEVLVMASDLVNDGTIVVDRQLREVTYVHILLARHQVVWANGLETESYHPSHTTLETVDPAQRAELLRLFPALKADPLAYGAFARRNLTASEAAILRHALVA